MTVQAHYNNDILHIRLSGEMDEHTAAYARRESDALITRYPYCKSAVFDLREVSFMDSTGIGFLIGRYKNFQKRGIPVYVANASQSTDKILSMSGVYTLIPKL